MSDTAHLGSTPERSWNWQQRIDAWTVRKLVEVHRMYPWLGVAKKKAISWDSWEHDFWRCLTLRFGVLFLATHGYDKGGSAILNYLSVQCAICIYMLQRSELSWCTNTKQPHEKDWESVATMATGSNPLIRWWSASICTSAGTGSTACCAGGLASCRPKQQSFEQKQNLQKKFCTLTNLT